MFYIIYLGHYWILLAFDVIRFIWHVSRQHTPTLYTRTSPKRNFALGALCREATCVLLFVTRKSRLAYAGIPFHSCQKNSVRRLATPYGQGVRRPPHSPDSRPMESLGSVAPVVLPSPNSPILITFVTFVTFPIRFQSLSIFPSLCHAKHGSRSPLHLALWPSSPSAQRNAKDFPKTDTIRDNSFDRQLCLAAISYHCTNDFKRDKSR